MKISGIYQIQSKVKPERIYIGSAVNIDRRWKRHLDDLRHDKHHSKKLQRHFNKYNEVDLQFSILLGCDEKDLLKVEQYFLDSYNTYFNNSKTAGSNLGRRYTEAEKKNMYGHKTRLGAKVSEETKDKISRANLGKKASIETRNKMREMALRNKRKPPLFLGLIPWNKGLKNPEGVKGKITKLKIA